MGKRERKRTDRLYRLVDELRRVAPELQTSTQLAQAMDVSTRTIERDLVTLQEAGLPIRGTAGPHGGYNISTDRPLPPLDLTPSEAAAIAIALHDTSGGPFVDAALSARRKVVASMAATDPAGARRLAGLAGPVIESLREAIGARQVVELRFRAADGTLSHRTVEPIGLVSRDKHWFLMAWCRTADDHRSFRLERIEEVQVTGDVAAHRDDVVPDAMWADQPHLFD